MVVNTLPTRRLLNSGWGGHLALFAEHFRVLCPDTRGHGRTGNPSGAMSYPLWAQDMLAFIEALGLDHPLIAGFSDGGAIAALTGILDPAMPRAVVDLAGSPVFNPDPEARGYRAMRQLLGGSPEATSMLAALERNGFDLRLREADFEPVQGPGYLRAYLESVVECWTNPMSYTFEDYRRITAPTLILLGDRDEFLSLPEAVGVFERLPQGEVGGFPTRGMRLLRQAASWRSTSCDVIAPSPQFSSV